MSSHRDRIHILAPAPHMLELMHWVTPAGAQVLGYAQRGNDRGRLLRLVSGILVIQLPGGAITTLDQRKAQAMLDTPGQ